MHNARNKNNKNGGGGGGGYQVIPGGLFNKRYPSETHLKLKSHRISFLNNLFPSCQIFWQFFTEHGFTSMPSAKFLTDFTTEMDVMEKRDFERIKLKLSCGRIPYIATAAESDYILPFHLQYCAWYRVILISVITGTQELTVPTLSTDTMKSREFAIVFQNKSLETPHHQNHWWPRFLSSRGVTGPQ